jgi:hypothetical protein
MSENAGPDLADTLLRNQTNTDGSRKQWGGARFDPMQGAEEECGSWGKMGDGSLNAECGTKIRVATSRRSTLGAAFRIQTQISLLIPVPAFLFCTLHRAGRPSPRTAGRRPPGPAPPGTPRNLRRPSWPCRPGANAPRVPRTSRRHRRCRPWSRRGGEFRAH